MFDLSAWISGGERNVGVVRGERRFESAPTSEEDDAA